MNKTASASIRKRGRGTTALARKNSRAAFKAHDTRLANEAAERRRLRRIANKAVATRRKNASARSK